MKIIKRPITTGNPELDALLNNLFDEIIRQINTQTVDYIQLKPLKKKPDRPFNGMVVYFDNVDGMTGFYGYENGSWVKL